VLHHDFLVSTCDICDVLVADCKKSGQFCSFNRAVKISYEEDYARKIQDFGNL
jgi:hypothetical protein